MILIFLCGCTERRNQRSCFDQCLCLLKGLPLRSRRLRDILVQSLGGRANFSTGPFSLVRFCGGLRLSNTVSFSSSCSTEQRVFWKSYRFKLWVRCKMQRFLFQTEHGMGTSNDGHLNDASIFQSTPALGSLPPPTLVPTVFTMPLLAPRRAKMRPRKPMPWFWLLRVLVLLKPMASRIPMRTFNVPAITLMVAAIKASVCSFFRFSTLLCCLLSHALNYSMLSTLITIGISCDAVP